MAEAILQKVVNDLYKRKFASCGNETAKGDSSYSLLLPNGHYREDRDRLSSEVSSDRAEGPRAQVAREVVCEEKTLSHESSAALGQAPEGWWDLCP